MIKEKETKNTEVKKNVQVLIIGAGGGGLAMSLLLLQQGVKPL